MVYYYHKNCLGKYMSLHNYPNSILKARALRKNMTKEERRRWYDFLCKHPLHFRRQKAIGYYIVDFYCEQAHLVIELDGPQHHEPDAVEYDAIRTEYLQAAGLTVLRFNNSELHADFRAVCNQIQAVVDTQI